jgi:hypothetical protein
MLAYGSDRVRILGEKVILQSAISKGWTPRTPKTLAHSEHPGTTVLWEERYLEVVEANVMQNGSFRYVLAPWRDEHVIRTFEHYDAASEALRIEDHERARRQRRASVASRLSSMLLGHLPASVQNHLQNELGVSPPFMTVLSCIPVLVLAAFLVSAYAGARVQQTISPVPLWVWPLLFLLMLETFIRFYVAMSQRRGMGSMLGGAAHLLYRRFTSKLGDAAPAVVRGEAVTFTPPTEEIALHDSLEMKSPFLTLLTPAEQRILLERYGFEYRRHAFIVAGVILFSALAGVGTSWVRFGEGGGFSALLSMLVAAAVVIEQIVRLRALRTGPAGSVFGALVRPFARDLLR